MKYRELKEPCKSAIAEGRCLGCNKLELEEFECDIKCEGYEKKKEYSRDWKIGQGRSGKEVWKIPTE